MRHNDITALPMHRCTVTMASGHVSLRPKGDQNHVCSHAIYVFSTAVVTAGRLGSLTGQDQLRPSLHGPADISSDNSDNGQECSAL